jgi:predicted NUDIX family phosphoesterase
MCAPEGTRCSYANDDDFCWLPKQEAEVNEKYRQVIPYCAVQRNTDGKFLVYDRAGGEDRLHGLASFGIGGHIEDGESFCRGMYRELSEEARIESTVDVEYLGKICLDKTMVDRVHLGFAFHVKVEDASPQEELLNARWLTIDELREIKDGLEPWSNVLLDFIVNPF